MSLLAPTLQAFFTDRLIHQRDASPKTIKAYRDSFRLLLRFIAEQTGTQPFQLDLADLDAPMIGAFLTHLEHDRGNSPRTRNARLAAIHSFCKYAALRHPEHAATIARVIEIPSKRYDRTDVTYLINEEIDALLAAPDPATWLGRRDHALILTMITTGVRVAELIALRIDHVTTSPTGHIRVLGKGDLCRIRHRSPYVAPGTMLRSGPVQPPRVDRRLVGWSFRAVVSCDGRC
jgi:integrase/recombinase XerD